MFALFLAWNLDLVYHIPGIGGLARKFRTKGKEILKEFKWVRRLAFVSIILLVIIPFQGTGAVLSSMVGRIIGLGKYKVLLAVTIGAISGTLLVAFLTASAFAVADYNFYVFGVFAIIAVAAINRFYHKHVIEKKRK